MNRRFVIKRVLQVFLLVFTVLTVVYVGKGQAVTAALQDAALWAFIASLIFAGSLFYHYKARKPCEVCVETPPSQKS